jgi:hypothetical protein
MSGYRVFFRDLSGRMKSADEFEADTDLRAMEMGADLAKARGPEGAARFEVWQGTRMIVTGKISN